MESLEEEKEIAALSLVHTIARMTYEDTDPLETLATLITCARKIVGAED